MATNELIDKYRELVKHIERYDTLWSQKAFDNWEEHKKELKSEIAALESQAKEPGDTLYAFLYNSMTEESSWATMSVHRTRKGAEMAMEFHKAEALKEFNRNMKWREENCEIQDIKVKEEYLKGFKFGQFEDWRIGEIHVIN